LSEGHTVGFTSIGGYTYNKEHDTTVYKIFSHAPLNDEQLDAMFSYIHHPAVNSDGGFHTRTHEQQLQDADTGTNTSHGRGVYSRDWLAYPVFGETMKPDLSFRPLPGVYHVSAFEAAVSC